MKSLFAKTDNSVFLFVKNHVFNYVLFKGVNQHWFHDSIQLWLCQRFDISMHHDYIKFSLCNFIKLYKQATFLNNSVN